LQGVVEVVVELQGVAVLVVIELLLAQAVAVLLLKLH
jgi:hypothetical protein